MQTFAYILSYCFVLAQKMFIITQFDFVQTTMCCFKTSSNNDFSDFFQDLLGGKFFNFFQFLEILKFPIFLVIPGS